MFLPTYSREPHYQLEAKLKIPYILSGERPLIDNRLDDNNGIVDLLLRWLLLIFAVTETVGVGIDLPSIDPRSRNFSNLLEQPRVRGSARHWNPSQGLQVYSGRLPDNRPKWRKSSLRADMTVLSVSISLSLCLYHCHTQICRSGTMTIKDLAKKYNICRGGGWSMGPTGKTWKEYSFYSTDWNKYASGQGIKRNLT